MLPLLAFVLPVLVLFCGLAVDVNALQNAQAVAQTAADTAAIAAALEYQSGSGNQSSIGKGAAALNGVTDGSNNAVVALTQRPTAGPYAGRDDALAVTVTQPSPTYFMRWLTGASVGAAATALVPPCIVLRGTQALSAVSSHMQTSCPVYSNGAVSLSSTSWSSTGVLLTSSGSLSTAVSASVASAVRNVGDPLASVQQPAAGGCNATNFTQSGGSVTLQPGKYCSGMTLRNANVTLAPGLYTFTGGAHWTGVTLQGTGVTLFFTGSASGHGQFIIDGNSNVSLSAPVNTSAGGVPAIVVFTDRNWSPISSTDFQITSSTVQTNGIWYAATTGLALNNATLKGPTYLGLDLTNLTLSSSTVQGGADLSSIATGNPFQPLGGLAQ